MLNSAKASSGQIAVIIEKDSVLSGAVLRSVNSAYYGLPSRVSSIRHAVTLLGFATVRNLALAFSMRQMLVKPQMPSRQLYSEYSQHALGCAIMTQFLAHYTRSEEIEAAFAAGLFHDIGRLLIIVTFPEVIPEIAAHWDQSEGSLEESEKQVLDVTHSELSGVVLAKWKLPESIQQAVVFHHDPDSSPPVSGQPVSLAHLVHAADLYARFYGLEVLASEVLRERLLLRNIRRNVPIAPSTKSACASASPSCSVASRPNSSRFGASSNRSPLQMFSYPA